MRVLFALTFLAARLYICNAFTIPNFFNWFLDFDDQNEIDSSSQNRDLHGFRDTQRQSRGGGHQSFDTQGLSGYQHQHIEGHHYADAEDAPSDLTDHILPVFLIAFCASIVNSLFLFKSVPQKGTNTCYLLL